MAKSTVRYANGDFYEGEYKNDIRHGKGKYTYVNGYITVQGIYENNMCIDFIKVIIKSEFLFSCFFDAK